ncbi:MAG: PqiC family protein [Pseudomonadota bacterium]
MKNLYFLLLALTLTACTSSPEPRRFLLGSTMPIEPIARSEATKIRVGIADIQLPAYARGLPIANLTSSNEIVVDDDNRWASPLAESLSRAMAESLEARLGVAVLVRPYPRGFRPELEFRVTVDRFVRTPAGAADIRGQFVINSQGDVAAQRFSILVPASSDSYNSYADAVAEAVNEITHALALAAADEST